jgi:hypothetical protein
VAAVLAACCDVPLVAQLAAILVTSVTGGYGIGTWSGKVMARMYDFDKAILSDVLGEIGGAVGFLSWLGYATTVITVRAFS